MTLAPAKIWVARNGDWRLSQLFQANGRRIFRRDRPWIEPLIVLVPRPTEGGRGMHASRDARPRSLPDFALERPCKQILC